MKTALISILNDEYSVCLYLGKPKELTKAVKHYFGEDVDEVAEGWENKRRGMCFTHIDPKKPPLIIVNSLLDYKDAIATIAHEASHAVDSIAEFIKLDDKSGEFKAHGIGAVMRAVGKLIKAK